MVNYSNTLRSLLNDEVNFRDDKELIFSLLFYNFASKKYEISKEYTIENIVVKNNSLELLKKGIDQLVQINSDDKLGYEAFHDIFDLINFDEQHKIEFIVKTINKIDINNPEAYEMIFKDNFLRNRMNSKTNIATKIMSQIINTNFLEVDELYNPNSNYGDLILQLNKSNNVGMFYGAEKDFNYYILCKMRLLINGLDYNKFLVKNFSPADCTLFSEKFDVSLSQLPVNRKDYDKEFNCNYVYDSIKHLKDDGIIGLIVRDSELYSNRDFNLRQYLIEKHYISAIINLNDSESKLSTALLLLKKNSSDVLFVNFKGNFSNVKKENKITDDEISEIVEIFNERLEINSKSRVVSLDEIKDNDYNFSLKRYIDTDPLKPIDIVKTFSEIKNIKRDLTKVNEKLKAQEAMVYKTFLKNVRNSIEKDELDLDLYKHKNFKEFIINSNNTEPGRNNSYELNIPTIWEKELIFLANKLNISDYGPMYYRFLGLSILKNLEENKNDCKSVLLNVIGDVDKLLDKISGAKIGSKWNQQVNEMSCEILGKDFYYKYYPEKKREEKSSKDQQMKLF